MSVYLETFSETIETWGVVGVLVLGFLVQVGRLVLLVSLCPSHWLGMMGVHVSILM